MQITRKKIGNIQIITKMHTEVLFFYELRVSWLFCVTSLDLHYVADSGLLISLQDVRWDETHGSNRTSGGRVWTVPVVRGESCNMHEEGGNRERAVLQKRYLHWDVKDSIKAQSLTCWQRVSGWVLLRAPEVEEKDLSAVKRQHGHNVVSDESWWVKRDRFWEKCDSVSQWPQLVEADTVFMDLAKRWLWISGSGVQVKGGGKETCWARLRN